MDFEFDCEPSQARPAQNFWLEAAQVLASFLQFIKDIKIYIYIYIYIYRLIKRGLIRTKMLQVDNVG